MLFFFQIWGVLITARNITMPVTVLVGTEPSKLCGVIEPDPAMFNTDPDPSQHINQELHRVVI